MITVSRSSHGDRAPAWRCRLSGGGSGSVRASADAVRCAAAEAGAGLVIFPEMFLTGYNIGDAVFNLAEPADGPSAAAVAAIAGDVRGCHPLRLPGARTAIGSYNSAHPASIRLGRALPTTARPTSTAVRKGVCSRPGMPGDGRAGRAADRHPDLLRRRVSRGGAVAGAGRRRADRRSHGADPALRHRGPHAGPGQGIRKPGLCRLCRHVRQRGADWATAG
ncbi:MAG: hypothetical protein MZV70_16105 [Desulfobacterales bacterium]|nr:hypothetical protein [Desulfobacterales bacterium]